MSLSTKLKHSESRLWAFKTNKTRNSGQHFSRRRTPNVLDNKKNYWNFKHKIPGLQGWTKIWSSAHNFGKSSTTLPGKQHKASEFRTRMILILIQMKNELRHMCFGEIEHKSSRSIAQHCKDFEQKRGERASSSEKLESWLLATKWKQHTCL